MRETNQHFFFQIYCGVRQGKNLSPILFSLFLNDLESYVNSHNASSVDISLRGNDIDTYLKIFILLYADDTVLFGTDAEIFQGNLNIFYKYAQLWKF